MMKTNIKMRVTPEQSKKVQEIVFDNGGAWKDTGSYFFEIGYDYIFLSESKEMLHGEKDDFDCEEVDADLFIRTNGTCEEEPHAELKRKYESGDYIAVWNFPISKWQTISDFGEFTNDQLNQKDKYKLIHKRHKEVLEHWLNGGEVEWCTGLITTGYTREQWVKVDKFIDKYHEDIDYRIIKQNQQQTRTFSTKKELADALMRGEKWKDKYGFICYFSEESNNPFFASDGEKGFILDNQQWEQCDGKTLWTKVND